MSQTSLQKHISRLMALLLCALLLVPCIPIARAEGESGSCGDNLSWTLSDGTLTITGSGAMRNYTESTMAPWYSVRGEIIRLSLPDSLTTIGDLAFYDCHRLTTVDIPDSVTEIGALAFASCEKLELLDLGDGLRTIKADAFHGCWELKNLRLPQTMAAIGNQAFYDCSSITSVVIPSGVTSLGSAAFAYCTSLVRAEIQTQITILPDWTFFGCSQLSTLILPSSVGGMGNAALRDCSSLNTVSYGGSNISTSELKSVIAEDVPGFQSTGNVTSDLPGNTAVSGTATENADGTVTEQITTVISGENSTVSSTIDRTFQTEGDDTVSSDIIVNIENDDGWQDAVSGIQSALEDVADRREPGTTTGTTNITVHIKDSESLSEELLEPLAGRDVIVTVVTKDGAAWKIDCATMVGQELSGTYDLRYTLEPADKEALDHMGTSQGYYLRFAESAMVQAEVMIQLPDSTIRQTATLFQKESGNELSRIQSVVVDRDGYAHFYIGAVDSETEYYLGINVPDTQNEAIIPENLYDEYTLMDSSTGKPYVITGRKSSWNMGLGKVMAILAVIMVSAIGVVGAVMYFWNKQRLKNGYVPQWDDEDET